MKQNMNELWNICSYKPKIQKTTMPYNVVSHGAQIRGIWVLLVDMLVEQREYVHIRAQIFVLYSNSF